MAKVRLQISFKENVNDLEIYNYILEKSETIGISSYIKSLVKSEMEKEKETK